MARPSMSHRLPNVHCERPASEAAFRLTDESLAGGVLQPSTPHYPPRHQRGTLTHDQLSRHAAHQMNLSSRGMEAQAPSGFLQNNQNVTATTHFMRGVITGPARWRGNNQSYGTPVLYCAVYGYDFSPPDASVSASSENQNSDSGVHTTTPSLPLPNLVSSTWGQGPLVIEGVPVNETHTHVGNNTRGENERHSTYVLVVGAFRSSSSSSNPLLSPFCGGGSSLRNPKISTAVPRPEDLLGVLYVPLHCVHLVGQQQEVKLRLPVGTPLPPEGAPTAAYANIEDDGERALAAVLSPACQLERLEVVFRNGLKASSTSANRCNVMLFRLSGNSGYFLSSEALFQAALGAPLTPSMASSAHHRASHATGHHDIAKFHTQGKPETSAVRQSEDEPQVVTGVADPESTHNATIREHISSTQPVPKSDNPLPGLCEVPTHSGCATQGALASGSHSIHERQKQRQQRRHQELSVAAVLAASAIAAAARGERDWSSRSAASRQPVISKRLETALGARGTQRPASVCGVGAASSSMQQKSGSSLGLQPQPVGRQHATGLERGLTLTGKAAAATAASGGYGSADAAGEHDLSPDDSVSVRGEETHRLARTFVSRALGSGPSKAASSFGERLVPRDCDMPFDEVADDRKSTISTSIRRLDCLMIRAELLLSQRARRQQTQDMQQQLQQQAHQQMSHLSQRDQKNPLAGDLYDSPSLFFSQQHAHAPNCLIQGTPKSGGHRGLAPTTSPRNRHHNVALPSTSCDGLQKLDSPSSACYTWTTQNPKVSFSGEAVSKMAKWVVAPAHHPAEVLTQRVAFKAWLQETQMRRQRRYIAGLRLAAATAGACKGVIRLQQLQWGWMVLAAHAVARRQLMFEAENPAPRGILRDYEGAAENDRLAEEKQNSDDRQRVQELIQMVVGLQHQLRGKDELCQNPEKRNFEEQQSPTQDLDALRRQLMELEKKLKQRNSTTLVALPDSATAFDLETQRLLKELEKSANERRQLQLLVAEHAAAKVRSDEQQRRMQNELVALQERTRDLEQQLLLVDEQLVGILKHAVPAATPLKHQEKAAESAQPTTISPLGFWAVQQLQGMRDTLKVVQEKQQLGPSAGSRRQPPLQDAALSPLHHMPCEPCVHSGNTQNASSTEQHRLKLTSGPQGPMHEPLQQPVLSEEEGPAGMAPVQPQHSKMTQGSLIHHQKTGYLTPGGLNTSIRSYVRTPTRSGATPQADGYPWLCGTRLAQQAHGDMQRQQPFQMPQRVNFVPRSQQVREQLDRQRTHRQQLLQRGALLPPQLQMQQPLHSPLSSHLQTSFNSMQALRHLPVKNTACPMPLQQPLHQPYANMDRRLRSASAQRSACWMPSRPPSRHLNKSVT